MCINTEIKIKFSCITIHSFGYKKGKKLNFYEIIKYFIVESSIFCKKVVGQKAPCSTENEPKDYVFITRENRIKTGKVKENAINVLQEKKFKKS